MRIETTVMQTFLQVNTIDKKGRFYDFGAYTRSGEGR